MPSLKQFVSNLHNELKGQTNHYTPAVQGTILSLAMATFGKTRFASHIKFVSTCLRRHIIPNGFRLKFNAHVSSDTPYQLRSQTALNQCSRKLMRSALSTMTIRKKQYDSKMKFHRSQLDSLIPDNAEPRRSIHCCNSKLYEFLHHTKQDKLDRLTPPESVDHTNASSLSSNTNRLVVTIPSDLPLSRDEHSVLQHGLNYVPLENSQNEFEVRRDIEAFFRRLRLKYHFQDQNHSENPDPDPFANLQPKASTWTPPTGENRFLDKTISKCRDELEQYVKSNKTYKSNLSKNEIAAMKKLKANRDIVIKSADKGGAVVVWDKDLYIQEANRQLSDATTYTKINEDPTAADQKVVSDTVKNLIKNKHLPSSAKSLINPCPQIANFYMLPKIHKPNSPGRPISSSHSCPTVFIATYLDSILTPIVSQLPTFIQDSPHALRILQDFTFCNPGPRFLFTMDISSLYTSLPHDLCMKALEHFLNKRTDQSVSTETLLRLCELVLTTNSMQFNGDFYKQCKGIAMGSRIGPGVACLTMGYIEETMLAQYCGPAPLLFKRYIDDILGIFSGSREDLEKFIQHVSNYHEAIKFTHDISNESVAFLDLKITIQDDKIATSIYFKETDSHSYLKYDSSHPPACKKSIPYSQFLRAKRICSQNEDFESVSKDMIGFFDQRGYPSGITQSALQRVRQVDRSHILQPSDKTKSNRTPLVLTYHPKNIPIRNIIFKHYKALQSEPTTKEIFNEPPVTAFRKDRNISNHLVRASHPIPHHTINVGTYSCKRTRCNTCAYVAGNVSRVQGPRGHYDIKDSFTCTSTNVVYVITCERCKTLYVGETSRRLADRFTEHLRSIKCNFDGYPVARHFNAPSQCTINHVKVMGVIQARGQNKDRIIAEHKLIFKLGSVQPEGLNSKFDCFNL